MLQNRSKCKSRMFSLAKYTVKLLNEDVWRTFVTREIIIIVPPPALSKETL